MNSVQSAVCMFCFLMLSLVSCSPKAEQPQPEPPAPAESKTEPAMQPAPPAATQQQDPKFACIGDWVRTDAEYVLHISQLNSDGTVQVQYLNPTYINVGKATWREENGLLIMYVELRDVNYPGSNYTLVYMPQEDKFSGQYYQAVEQATYQVSFKRVN